MRKKTIKYCATAIINPKTGKAYKNRWVEVSWKTSQAPYLYLDPRNRFYKDRLKSLSDAGYTLVKETDVQHTLKFKTINEYGKNDN